jgi:hypothetical protein
VKLRAPLLAWLALLALPALLPAAAAYDEQDAGLLRPDVLEASHSPGVVQPHAQWRGTLVLRPGHQVLAAQYQICRVGQACFAPPAPAQRVGNDTFTFDTADYLANGHPVDYQAGWRIGVQWILTERDGNQTRSVPFPAGPGPSDPGCAGDGQALACQERHYLAFEMPPAEKGAPALGAPLLAVVLLGLAFGRMRRRHG